jgi:hypothetical protein
MPEREKRLLSRGLCCYKQQDHGHSLVFVFSGASGKKQPSTVGSDMKSLSAGAGMVAGTGAFSSYSGELNFSAAWGGTLAKGGFASPPAMVLSISGALHKP